MSHIKKIRFQSVGRNEGCTCDRCGQYIRNIWSVDYAEGFTVNYGIDCWEKVYKAGQLSKYGEKELRKIMKRIRDYEKMLETYKSGEMTEEIDGGYKTDQMDCFKDHYWHGKPYEQYKAWMIEECIPARIARAQEDLKKFKNIDFKD